MMVVESNFYDKNNIITQMYQNILKRQIKNKNKKISAKIDQIYYSPFAAKFIYNDKILVISPAVDPLLMDL